MADCIMVVDDEPNYRLIIGQVLEDEGYEIIEAGNGGEAFEIFKEREDVGMVLTDITMPGGDGLELLSRIKAERPEVPVVMLTAHQDTKLTVQAMRLGALDYLTKPFNNPDLVRCVKTSLEVFSLARANKELRKELSQRYSFGSLIGKSKPMVELYQLLEKVSPTRANVLITGESGTGKELVAKAIHYNSPRAEKSFVAVNCSALSESLLVSELFGHEKGAYTGANTSRAGRFELAHQGTLFLDEVGEMGMAAQVTLLRVLQERAIERVGGGGKLIEVDTRLIAATNRDLKAEVAAGRFREDLFFRLNVVQLKLPPLRERLDDLPILAEHFIEKFAGDRKTRPSFDPATKRLLFAYHWPGNVRELENVVERAIVLASGDVIVPGDLPDEIRRLEAPPITAASPAASMRSAPSASGSPVTRDAPSGVAASPLKTTSGSDTISAAPGVGVGSNSGSGPGPGASPGAFPGSRPGSIQSPDESLRRSHSPEQNLRQSPSQPGSSQFGGGLAPPDWSAPSSDPSSAGIPSGAHSGEAIPSGAPLPGKVPSEAPKTMAALASGPKDAAEYSFAEPNGDFGSLSTQAKSVAGSVSTQAKDEPGAPLAETEDASGLSLAEIKGASIPPSPNGGAPSAGPIPEANISSGSPFSESPDSAWALPPESSNGLAGSLATAGPMDAAGWPIPPQPPSVGEEGGGSWVERVLGAVPAGIGLPEILNAFEEAVLRQAMRASDWVQSRAGDSLGLKRNVFKYKWDKFAGLEASELSERLSRVIPAVTDLNSVMASLEEELLRRALLAAKGVQGKAADLLGIKRTVMPYKLKKYPSLTVAADDGQRQG